MRRHVYSNGGLVLYARERKRYPAASFCPATTSREKEVTRRPSAFVGLDRRPVLSSLPPRLSSLPVRDFFFFFHQPLRPKMVCLKRDGRFGKVDSPLRCSFSRGKIYERVVYEIILYLRDYVNSSFESVSNLTISFFFFLQSNILISNSN